MTFAFFGSAFSFVDLSYPSEIFLLRGFESSFYDLEDDEEIQMKFIVKWNGKVIVEEKFANDVEDLGEGKLGKKSLGKCSEKTLWKFEKVL